MIGASGRGDQFGGVVTFLPIPIGFFGKLSPRRIRSSEFENRPGHTNIGSPFGRSRFAIWTITSCSRLVWESSRTSSWKGRPIAGSMWMGRSRRAGSGISRMRGCFFSLSSGCGWMIRDCIMITARAHWASLRDTPPTHCEKFPAVSTKISTLAVISSNAASTVVPFSPSRCLFVSDNTKTSAPATRGSSSHSRNTVSAERFSASRLKASPTRCRWSSTVRLYFFSAVSSKSSSARRSSRGWAVSGPITMLRGILVTARP
mmetsp:Transcript_28783/g.69130  ORF Transcript_28783/g.69130 Transcript_28783/m.69130 type:complete len:260 (+) Transcript_28783:436-1215(+)